MFIKLTVPLSSKFLQECSFPLGGVAPQSPHPHYGGYFNQHKYYHIIKTSERNMFLIFSSGGGPPSSFGGPSPHPQNGGNLKYA